MAASNARVDYQEFEENAENYETRATRTSGCSTSPDLFGRMTIEIGKKRINNWIRQRAYLQLFSGYNTEDCRGNYNYKKSSNKSAETFNSHCSDALAISVDVFAQEHIQEGRFRNTDNKRIGRTKLYWMSHHFKTKEAVAIPLPPNSLNLERVSLPTIR